LPLCVTHKRGTRYTHSELHRHTIGLMQHEDVADH
jgi:hypothetical protein